MDGSNSNSARRTVLKSALGVGMVSAGIGVFAQARTYSPGASDTEIVIGNTGPYSGPASAYALIPKAYGAYFQMVNEQGGVNGRKIRYISLDDAFMPPKTVEQVRRLVEKEQVLLMFGLIGSASALAVQKYLEERKVPNLCVATGLTRWGDYKRFPYTMGWGLDYTSETKAYTQYLLKEKPGAKIAVLYQNDDFGKEMRAGLWAGLGDKAKSMIVAERSYEVTDPTVDSQLISLQSSGADTLMNLSTPKFAAMAIRKVSQLGWKPTHFLAANTASIGAVFTPVGLDKCVGIISCASGWDPSDPQVNDPVLVEWRAWAKKNFQEGSANDGNGFGATLIARTLVQILRQCGDELTRENVMRQAANLKDFSPGGLLPGIKINTSPTDYYPIEQTRLRRFDGNKWVFFGELLGRA